MAWPWLSIIGLLCVAYYGVYAYVIGLKRGRIAGWQHAAGWTAAGLFLAMGFLFTHGMSLMTNVDAWPELWQRTSAAGAVRGTATNAGDPTVLPRWLLMIGIAWTTTAVHAVVDAGLLAPHASEAYRRWAPRFARRLQLFGALWFVGAGTWYVFGTWDATVRSVMLQGAHRVLTGFTAAGPVIVLAILLAGRAGATRRLAWCSGLAQFAVVGLNAVSRQVVQNLELRPYLDVAAEPVRTQWGPLVLFLGIFALGIAVTVWMVRHVARVLGRRDDAAATSGPPPHPGR
jgi:hypothetical protein